MGMSAYFSFRPCRTRAEPVMCVDIHTFTVVKNENLSGDDMREIG